jgi:lysophospholipase
MTSESRLARRHPAGARFDWWEAPDGQRLRIMDWSQAKPEKARGDLLFLGGRSDFIEKYIESYDHWHRSGWNVTAMDWRGQGLSRGKTAPENPESFDRLVEDLAGFLEAMRATSAGPGPLVAIGHSMGGHLLLRALADRSLKLEAAVLVAPMILANSDPVPDWMAPNFAEFMCVMGFRSRPMWKSPAVLNRPGSKRQSLLTACRERYEDELFWWQQHPEFRLGAPSWGWMRAAYRSSLSAFTRDKLSRIKVPLLFLGTSRDRLVSPAAIARAAALVPNAELAMFDDCAHEILREEDEARDDALKRIDDFLAARAS